MLHLLCERPFKASLSPLPASANREDHCVTAPENFNVKKEDSRDTLTSNRNCILLVFVALEEENT